MEEAGAGGGAVLKHTSFTVMYTLFSYIAVYVYISYCDIYPFPKVGNLIA